ncbi:MAG: uncharacterized protein KVP18_000175, partial [Porospora cf. gigantea A]|uniref:uncharacterized protein n=2 Tax=Porospora cf. gigantea A TaxID=2853593 RepID=UPI003559C92E
LNEVISVKEVHREMHNKGRSAGADSHNGLSMKTKARLPAVPNIDGSAKLHLRRLLPKMSAYRPFKTVFRTTNLNCLQKACKIPIKEAASMVLLTFLDSNSVSNVEFQDKPVRVACAPNTSGLCLALVPTFDEVGTLSVGPGVQSQMFTVAVGDAPRTVTFDPFSRILPLCHQLMFLLGIFKVQMEIPKSDSPATHVRLLQVPSWLSPDATVGYTNGDAHPPMSVAFSSDWEHIIWGETEDRASRTRVLLDLDVSTSGKDDKALHLVAILLHDGDIRLRLEPNLLSALFVFGRAYGIGVLSAVVAHQFLSLYLFEIGGEGAKRRPLTRTLQTPLGSVMAAASVLTVTCYLFPSQSMDSPFHYSPMETSVLVALLGWGCSEAFCAGSRLITLAGSWVLPYIRSLRRVTRPTLPPRSLDYLLVLLFPIPTGLLYLLPRSLFYVFPFVRMLAVEEGSNRLARLLLSLDIATAGFVLMLLFNLPSLLFFNLMTPRPGFLATGLMTPFANSLLVGGVPHTVLLCSFMQVLPFLLYSRFTRKVTKVQGQFEIVLFGWMTDHPLYPPALFCLFVLVFLFTR